MEVHPDPDQAKCDGPNSIPLKHVQSILDQVAPLLRSGGHLLYSVCTFTAAETAVTVPTR